MIAYFSMEIGIDPQMPTYSGGLGVFAAGAIRSAAELKVPLVAVILLHRKGYFRQTLSADGRQSEEPANWPAGRFFLEDAVRITISLEGHLVTLRAWRYQCSRAVEHSMRAFLQLLRATALQGEVRSHVGAALSRSARLPRAAQHPDGRGHARFQRGGKTCGEMTR